MSQIGFLPDVADRSMERILAVLETEIIQGRVGHMKVVAAEFW